MDAQLVFFTRQWGQAVTAKLVLVLGQRAYQLDGGQTIWRTVNGLGQKKLLAAHQS